MRSDDEQLLSCGPPVPRPSLIVSLQPFARRLLNVSTVETPEHLALSLRDAETDVASGQSPSAESLRKRKARVKVLPEALGEPLRIVGRARASRIRCKAAPSVQPGAAQEQ
jgi:hypothetical protein